MTGSTIPPRRSRAKIVAGSVILSHNSIRAKDSVEFVCYLNLLHPDWLSRAVTEGLVSRATFYRVLLVERMQS
jgi:hypothetical protein